MNAQELLILMVVFAVIVFLFMIALVTLVHPDAGSLPHECRDHQQDGRGRAECDRRSAYEPSRVGAGDSAIHYDRLVAIRQHRAAERGQPIDQRAARAAV